MPRSAVCVAENRIVFVVVEGGLSLYELAKLLIASPAQGGFGCERALNLDLFQGFEESVIDLYSAVRHGYLQRREKLIRE